MSVLRAILGRFARFLVRIARTLDPGVAATPYWVMPERMAALRLRYPGAPEQWLELLARRTSLGDPASNHAHNPEPAAGRAGPQPRFGGDVARAAPRAAPRFPAAIRSARPVVQPGAASTAPHPAHEPARAASRGIRPVLTFAVGRARNPIANLLRGRASDERRAEPHFDHAPPGNAAPDRPDVGAVPHRAPVALFPQPGPHSSHPVEWIGPRQPQAPQWRQESSPGWPEFHYSAAPGPSWPGEAAKQARYNPRFAASDNRWPELPPFLDEAGAAMLGASDEAALLAEQIGGSWSA